MKVDLQHIAGLIFLSLVASACAAPRATPAGDGITASGTVDAETVAITSQLGGRLREVLAAEGDAVAKGTILIRLDTALLDAQVGEAEATVLAARARLDEVKAGARPEAIRVAEANLAQAKAQARAAKQAWENASTIMNNPQELEDRIDQARTQVELAKVGVEQAEAQLHAAEVQRDGYSNPSTAYVIAQQQVEAAQARLEQARSRYAGARKALENLLDMRENPLEMETQVHSAEANYHQANAAVEAAQANLELLRAGPMQEEIAAAAANLKQAEAALEALQIQRNKLTLEAPVNGLIVSRAAQPGEIASPGATLLRLADLDRVKLTIYVPETQIARVRLGQPVDVSVDAYPDRAFRGEVTFIAQEAEFTPRNVQTEDQRANLVFEVRVSLDNSERLLKPGMPADATILSNGGN